MKKTIIILSIIISILVVNKESKVVIPKESIRFRVVANSNSEEDQSLKKEIIHNLKNNLIDNNPQNIVEERKYLKKQLPEFTKIVDKTISSHKKSNKFTINYGKNYFPEKKYKNIVYKEGDYESLVITLGNGTGDNFWCVLFPPLCLIDEDANEYPSIIQEIINKYF